MAVVFLAEDCRLGRLVAVKRLEAAGQEDAIRRFEREARLGAALNHPNVVQIYDTARDGEGLLIVMEYVEGPTLEQRLADERLSPAEALEILRGAADALDHAHEHGVLHRDVKPANILLRRDGVVKVADLGIATAAEASQITPPGRLLGTPTYLAPELFAGESATRASDVYALAAIAFEALSGTKIQSGSTPLEVAYRVSTEPPPDLREAWPEAPEAAAEALRCALSRDPAERPASAGDLVRELEAALRSVAVPEEDAPDATAAPVEPPVEERPGPRVRPPLDTAAASATPRRPVPPPPPQPPDPPTERMPQRAPAPERQPPPPAREPLPAASPAGPARGRGRGGRVVVAAALLLVAAAAVGILLASGAGDGERSNGGEGAAREEPAGGRASGEPRPRDRTEEPPTAPVAPTTQAGADPAEGARLNDQGFALIEQGRYDEAVPVLQRSVELFPAGSDDLNYAYALFNLGRALRLSGRPEEAIPILERRAEIPNQPEAVQAELDAARRDAAR